MHMHRLSSTLRESRFCDSLPQPAVSQVFWTATLISRSQHSNRGYNSKHMNITRSEKLLYHILSIIAGPDLVKSLWDKSLFVKEELILGPGALVTPLQRGWREHCSFSTLRDQVQSSLRFYFHGTLAIVSRNNSFSFHGACVQINSTRTLELQPIFFSKQYKKCR